MSGHSFKIGLDAHALAAVGTGNHSYIRGLIDGLREIDHKNHYFLYGTNAASATAQIQPASNFQPRPLRWHNAIGRNLVDLPLAQRADHLDIFHGQFFLPIGLRCRTVVSIHDLCYEHYPKFFGVYERVMLRRFVRASAHRADKVLTLSEFSKRDIAQRYHIDPAKIKIVQPGIEPHFKPVRDPAQVDEIKSRYELGKSFILFFGRTDPRKGVDVLIRAYQSLRAQNGLEHNLIIAGRAGSADASLRDMVKAYGLEAHVRFVGIVPDADLSGVISSAEFVVYPSIFEGFGLPALEAMACATPVITTNASALPEVVSGAGLMFEPGNVSELVQAMKQLLDSDAMRRGTGAAGLARAQNFSWTQSADEVLRIYENVMVA